MSYVKRVIAPDETLIGISSAHWTYGAKGLIWLGLMAGIGRAGQIYGARYFGDIMGQGTNGVMAISDAVFWIPSALGGIMFIIYLLMMIGAEIALTTKRVIYKRGIVFVDVKEVDLEEIKAANVDSGMLGRVFNYGYIKFDARFVTGMDLPAIGKPYRFVKALNDARAKLKEDSMTVVLEGAGEAVQQEIAAAKGEVAKVEVLPPEVPQPPPPPPPPPPVAEVPPAAVQQEVSPGPVVFKEDPVRMQKRLHDKIIDNFESTSGP